MPVLKNAKHEAFAQGLAKGLSADEAYQRVGYSPNRGNATRLKANESVMKRVAELQSKAVKKVEITVESLALELEEARSIAIGEKQSSAAVAATMGKAKLFGLGIERRHHSGQVTVLNVTPDQLRNLSDHELADLERAFPVLQKLGVVTAGDQSGTSDAGSEPED